MASNNPLAPPEPLPQKISSALARTTGLLDNTADSEVNLPEPVLNINVLNKNYVDPTGALKELLRANSENRLTTYTETEKVNITLSATESNIIQKCKTNRHFKNDVLMFIDNIFTQKSSDTLPGVLNNLLTKPTLLSD
jgi:hypothetical protein